MSYDNKQLSEMPTTRLRGTFWTFPDGPAASPRTACLTTSAAKSHIEASI
jgi:hypothetical protein